MPVWRSQFIYGKSQSINFVSSELFLRNLSRKVRVVVIAAKDKPIILMTTAMSLTPAQILGIYAARFSLELTIRDLKQHLGLGAYQATTILSFYRCVQLACCACTLGKLIPIQTRWGIKEKAGSSLARLSWVDFRTHLRRYVAQRLMAEKFAVEADFPSCQKDIEPILCLVA